MIDSAWDFPFVLNRLLDNMLGVEDEQSKRVVLLSRQKEFRLIENKVVLQAIYVWCHISQMLRQWACFRTSVSFRNIA